MAKCWACRACAVATRQEIDGAHAQCQLTVQQYQAIADRPLPCLAPLASLTSLCNQARSTGMQASGKFSWERTTVGTSHVT